MNHILVGGLFKFMPTLEVHFMFVVLDSFPG